ncbi:exopolysaccharide transport family protein [Paludisphaera soli]|uniref:exopolysaccharide transport family protein n=1 Tax=Paludisphaera soli TaxID=2712865 RepID=UPI0013EA562D|nr:AAA family ATPase [Paludisphaera soli]
MDTSDRHDSTLPARSPWPGFAAPARVAPSFGGGSRELATAGAPTMQVNPTSILRGLLRNWWKILGLWLLASAPLVYLIYTLVKPTYVAYSTIRVDPTQPELFGNGSSNASSIERNIETEIASVKSDQVLDDALGEVSELPFVKESQSPRTDLKERLSVFNPRNTYFIQVSLELNEAQSAAAIVRAVVAAYLEFQARQSTSGDKDLLKKMEDYLTLLDNEREKKTVELAKLMDLGTVSVKDLQAPVEAATKGVGVTEEALRDLSLSDVSIEQYRKYKDKLLEIRVQLFEAKTLLEQRTADFQEGGATEVAAGVPALSEAELAERIKAVFLADPGVADLRDEILSVQDRLSHVEKNARKANDPSKRAHEAQLKKLQDQHHELWKNRYASIRDDILAMADGQAPTPVGVEGTSRSIQELRAEVESLETKQKSLVDVLAQAEGETKNSNSDTFKAQRLQAQIDSYTANEQIVRRRLEDLKFRTDRGMVRVTLVDPAKVPSAPSSSKRLKLMAAAPMGILVLVLGIFSLLEVRAERVGDPDSLSTRVQSEVYALPPIPMSRSQRRLGAPGDDDQIDRFIQRLDHLRFAVCGDHPEVGLGRCVLISSAVGGEGKTTLAAQLAARCGHSGHSTLLIDADLRRGALSTLLDVADGPGLSDLMTNEELNVEDLAIPVQGGTFHLLSAGTPTSDTSRVFQGRAFGMLIARLRQLYDLIIIDTPPILPVPDALIMGRWTDGVVLASRYDVSRAPQVERARRQLDLAGIPVLGTVINGMRTSDSYYGRYTYSRPGGATPDPASTG